MASASLNYFRRYLLGSTRSHLLTSIYLLRSTRSSILSFTHRLGSTGSRLLSSTHLPGSVYVLKCKGHPGSSYLLARLPTHVSPLSGLESGSSPEDSGNKSHNGEKFPISGGSGGQHSGGQWWTGKSAVTMAASLAAAALTLGGTLYVHYMGEDTHAKHQLLSKALMKATLEEVEEEGYIPMPTLESEILYSIRAAHAVMVCGPRGVGKSTAVYHALQKTEGVVHLTLTTGTLDEFENQILDQVHFKTHDFMKVNVIHQALLDIHRKKEKPPIFIVEVNNQCKSKDVLDLLVRMKEWGSDKPLAKFVIILSLSRAALTIPVGLEELRVSTLSIVDPPVSVIEKRFDTYLKSLNDYKTTKNERKLILENHISKLGTRFLYIVGLIKLCIRHKCKTVKDVQAVSEMYTDLVVMKCEEAVTTFLECNENISTNKQLLKDLVAEKVRLKQLCNALKVDRVKFLDQLAQLHPHPFFVDPMTETVLMGNCAAKNKFQEVLNKLQ